MYAWDGTDIEPPSSVLQRGATRDDDDHFEYAGDADGSDLFTIEDVDVPYIEDVAPVLPSDNVTVTMDRLGRRHMGFPVSAATRQKISAARRRGYALRVIREAMRTAAVEEIIRLAANL